VDDIDAADGDNPLAVAEYVNDQYSFYRMKECRPGYDPNYMAKQPFINTRMRTILVDWLVRPLPLPPSLAVLLSNI
jgi:cyclin B